MCIQSVVVRKVNSTLAAAHRQESKHIIANMRTENSRRLTAGRDMHLTQRVIHLAILHHRGKHLVDHPQIFRARRASIPRRINHHHMTLPQPHTLKQQSSHSRIHKKHVCSDTLSRSCHIGYVSVTRRIDSQC